MDRRLRRRNHSVVEIKFTENGKDRKAISFSGILRGHTPANSLRRRVEDMVRALRRRRGTGLPQCDLYAGKNLVLERNSLSGKFRPARMA